jgi:hypothetical protein
MSERLTVTGEFDQFGKPIVDDEVLEIIGIGVKDGPCLIEQADGPDADIGSADCPKRCDSCRTIGIVEGGTFRLAVREDGSAEELHCNRFIDHSEAARLRRAEEEEERLRTLAGFTIQLIPRDRFPQNLDQAA